MDIESSPLPDPSQEPVSPLKNQQKLKHSIPSRMSNESLISIPGLNESRKYPQKISLESNISEKIRKQENSKGLFEQMVSLSETDDLYVRRLQYGSNPDEYNPNRMSEEAFARNNQISQSVQSAHQGHQNLEQLITEQKVVCRCSKSKCLLMYCQCFRKGLVCNSECECYQCRNNPQFEDKRQKARRTVLEKDPNAFTNKLEMIGKQQSELAYKRGCNCKKTNCFKKYCECFSANVKCTYLCQCEGCLNGGQNAYQG